MASRNLDRIIREIANELRSFGIVVHYNNQIDLTTTKLTAELINAEFKDKFRIENYSMCPIFKIFKIIDKEKPVYHLFNEEYWYLHEEEKDKERYRIYQSLPHVIKNLKEKHHKEK